MSPFNLALCLDSVEMLQNCSLWRERESFYFSLDKIQFRKCKNWFWVIYFSFSSLIQLTGTWNKNKRHILWDKPVKTHIWLFKSTSHPLVAFGIQHCFPFPLILIAFLFCKVRNTLNRGLFQFINIFIHKMLKYHWKTPAEVDNLCL